MSILFDNVRVYMDGAFFPGQKVLIEKGKIATVASNIPKKVDTVVDGQSKYLVPGLIDAHTHLGLFDHGYGPASHDMSEPAEPIAPHLRPLDGIKMRDQALQDARRAGVTTCLVCPGTLGPITGMCSILKTNGNSADVGLIVEQAGISFTFGEQPKLSGKSNKKFPSTRMGITALIRETLMKAQDYLELKNSKKGLRDRIIQMEALIPLLERNVPMRANAWRAEDIMAAIRIAEEFNLKIVLEHGTEAHLLADLLVEKQIPVILGPSMLPVTRTELREKSFETAKILMDKGVEVALSCDYPGMPIESLRIAAAIAVQYGLEERKAFRAICETPATILGVDHRVGKIRKGFDADVAMFNGHPLDIRSRLEVITIDGELFQF